MLKEESALHSPRTSLYPNTETREFCSSRWCTRYPKYYLQRSVCFLSIRSPLLSFASFCWCYCEHLCIRQLSKMREWPVSNMSSEARYHNVICFTTCHKSVHPATRLSSEGCSELTATACGLAARPVVWCDIFSQRRLYMPAFALWILCHTANPYWTCACHRPGRTWVHWLFSPVLSLSPWMYILRVFCNSSF